MQIRGSALVVGSALVFAGWLLAGAAPQVDVHPAGPFPAVERSVGAAIKPQDIVNIDSSNLAPGGNLPVPAAGWYTVLTVPPDRWFIMTNIQCDGVFGPYFELEEVAGSVATVKRGVRFLTNVGVAGAYGSEGLTSVLGLAFSPSSQVVLRNLDSGSAHSVNFTLTGFLAVP